MIGTVLAGRYRIESVVGTGGMAIVYRALDTQTDTTVAVKVLRREYEQDNEFVRRFSREAVAASKVSHENIVNMLDVGVEGDMRYIIMEYVNGHTLKELIREKGSIHPDVAIRMAMRILAAVDHAHKNGIVHRDIKPQNILVDEQGRVKVADFGIARLKASQTTRIDDGDGSALGSVHYFSPEQARGEVADEKSDLYSVGVVLYEMLTGEVPFDGETSVSVALKHVNEEPASMRGKKSSISKALDEVVLRALAKEPVRRYQTAAEMAADLRKTFAHPKGGFVQYPLTKEEQEARREQKRRQHQLHKRRLTRLGIAATAACVLATVIIAVWYFTCIYNTVLMPDLKYQSASYAQEALARRELVLETNYVYSETDPQGLVLEQSVSAKTRIKRGQSVTLTISLGSEWYDLPDLTAMPVADAESLLIQAGFPYQIEEVVSPEAVGHVCAQSAQGTLSRSTTITLYVSGECVSMPTLTGLMLEGAVALIEADGLVPGEIRQSYSADAQAGTVIAQAIAPGAQVLLGTVVDLTICTSQSQTYTPASDLSVVIPLEGLTVAVSITSPSGMNWQAFEGQLDQGTHLISLSSPEAGAHVVEIYMNGIITETLDIQFY